MTTVKRLLEKKGNNIYKVSPDTTVFDALSLMAEEDVGVLLVTENEALVGIFSERDYARKLALEGKDSKETKISELMSTDVLCISLDKTMQECMALMSNKHIRHLPVIDEEKVIGLISMRDVVTEVISEQEFEINELGKYISGRIYSAQ
ncbi:MAG: CBS domain-containing protein [Candidatus Zapsychrus exili]|nr:CBS domain-containing protein [Candidatus Zapsychrus exili]